MVIRTATSADRNAVVELALHFHAGTPYGALLNIERDRIASLFDMALAEGVVFVAAAEALPAAGPVAFLALVPLVHSLSGELYAEEVAWWVEPEYRSGTLGPRLLAHAETWALDRDCAFLKMVSPAGTVVGAYYQRRGYIEIETAYMKRLVA